MRLFPDAPIIIAKSVIILKDMRTALLFLVVTIVIPTSARILKDLRSRRPFPMGTMVRPTSTSMMKIISEKCASSRRMLPYLLLLGCQALASYRHPGSENFRKFWIQIMRIFQFKGFQTIKRFSILCILFQILSILFG